MSYDSEKKRGPEVSVIIPMYNCKAFVHDVLYMFSAQSFQDFEVICVIDGATDDTEAEVIKHCDTDDRFRYVVRENGGAGAARNTGMNLSKGKYIVFSDADDEYSKDYLRKLYEAAEKNDAEIAVCGAITFDYMKEEKGRTIGFSKNSLLEGRVYSAKKTKRLISKIDVQISNKMILFDFIKKHGIEFSETRASNDVFFSIALTACAERIVVIHDDLIKIRRFINPHSISSSRGKYSQIALMEIQKLYHWMNERDLLKYYLSDYLYWMDGALNYEMKNSVNPLLAKEMAHILNCDEPWIKIKSSQVIQILTNSLGDKGAEQILKPEQNTDDDEIKRLQNRNNIVKERNENRCRMQELIKKESIEIYDRDLDDPESISPVFAEYIKKREVLYSNQDHCDSLREVQVNPEITVVIPMYNCEAFVNEVLSMFSKQSFTDYEVICVIDGATDNTEKKVIEFCKNDPRFKYIVRENGGPGAARNTGLFMAKGKYIIFADADDEYSEDYLKKLYETAIMNSAQIVICRMFLEDNILNTKIVKGFNEKKFHENILYSHYCIDNLYDSFTPWINNKIYNTNFIKDNEILFSETRSSDDAFFFYTALSVAERIFVLHDPILTYRCFINPDSLTGKRISFQHEAVEVLRIFYQWLLDRDLFDIHRDDFFRRVKRVLIYDGEFVVSPRFVSEFSNFLNKEEPFKLMTSEEILFYLKDGLITDRLIKNEAEIKLKCSPHYIKKDKQLSLELERMRNRIHTAELVRKVSKERYGRDFSKPWSLPFVNPRERKDYYLNRFVPDKVRLEASTLCQLKCAGCGFQKGCGDDLGRGYLTISDFKRFCEMNPFVREIELSNWGEIFLNPDLVEIMYHARSNGIVLTAWNGSNFNTVSDEQMEALVETKFKGITLSIDGASQETYSKYRIGGDLNKVISNVRKLLDLKKRNGSEFPKVIWQYVLMEHNELEIGKAKEIANELGIHIKFQYNWDESYKPVNREYIMKETGLTELTRSEFRAAHGVSPYVFQCEQFFLKPQINWDGRLLGCCDQMYAPFDVNVFEMGLAEALNSSKYIDAKECLLTVHPDKEQFSSCSCYDCKIRKQREESGLAVEL